MGAIQDFVEGVRHYALYVPQCLANILKKKKKVLFKTLVDLYEKI